MEGVGSVEHFRPLFVSYKLLKAIDTYNIHLYTKTNINLVNTRQNVHQYLTRGRHEIDMPPHLLTTTGNSFGINCVNFFNKCI